MRAGTAKVCITPPVGTWQGGYGARTHPCEGIHDQLFARALVLEDDSGRPRGAIVSVDISGLPPEVADAARERAEQMAGIPAQHIALCASHTHGGPATRGFLGREDGPQADPDYLRILEKYLAGAVAAAARDLQPVRARLGRGQAGFNVNRRLRTPAGTQMRPNPEGAVDREVLVLRLDRDDGEPALAPSPLAILLRYTCHATAMGAQNYLITADYPGAAAAFVEAAYAGQTPALFLQGCAGNVRPSLVTPAGAFRGASWAELAQLGRELGAAAVAAAERAVGTDPGSTEPLAIAATTVLLPYAPPPDVAELRRLLADGRWPHGPALTETERRWASQTLEALAEGKLDDGMPAEVQVFRLGHVWLVTLPGEVFVEIGWHVRDAVASAAGVPAERVIVAAYANGMVGYVPAAAAIPEGGYEVTAYRHSGRISGYAPEAEDVLARTAAQLAAALAG
jgi:neutral ceramidase